MRHAYIHRGGHPRLIIIFAGWGMDERPFAGLSRPGYDIMAVWDYRTLDFDPAWIHGYEEVCVLAWSMGVQAAQMCHPHIAGRVTARIAVGGTPEAVSDTHGIPEAIFRGTLEGLDERSLARFMRRMCGGAAAYARFEPVSPQRPVGELRDELDAIGRRSQSVAAYGPRFDHCLVTAADAIFPPAAQRASHAGCDIVELDSPHLPDFQEILDRYFIDKSLVAQRFGRAHTTYDTHAQAQALIADYLAAQLSDTDTRCILHDPAATVLEVGCGTGLLTTRISAMRPRAGMLYQDIAPMPPAGIAAEAYCCCDSETSVMGRPEGSLDMIVSASAIQWFNSPERYVERALRALRHGGVLAVSTFGRDNLPEIAAVAGVGLHLADAATWRKALDSMPDAETVLVEERRIQCRFSSAMEALRHMSLTGVNAVARPSGHLRGIASLMQPDADGRYTITYSPIFILVRKA